jgi:hypothetical protein
MRFLIDEQLPAALARWLAVRGHEAEHVSDRHMQAVPDTAIWDFAVKEGATIITICRGAEGCNLLFNPAHPKASFADWRCASADVR